MPSSVGVGPEVWRVDDLHVEVHPGTGLPLLLVHGFLSSRAQWAPNLEALAQVSRPVVIELLGHGRSGAPEDPAAYAVERYWERFEAIRERLGVERWRLCGQSFGAGLTLGYALAHPQRVEAQVFTNSVSGLAPLPSPGAENEREARAAAMAAGGHAALAALPYYPRPSRRLPPSLWEPLVADGRLLSATGVANAIRATTPRLSVCSHLGDIEAPTLLVCGAREEAFKPLRDLAVAELRGIEVVDVPDGGHSVNLDSSEAFNSAVTAFLSRNSVVAPPRSAPQVEIVQASLSRAPDRQAKSAP